MKVLRSLFFLFFLFGFALSALGLEVTDDVGRTVILPRSAERVVSLTPANTEIVFALGAGEKLVGVTTYCNYPEEAQKKEKIGNIIEVDLEAVVRLQPDLVLAGSLTPPEVVEKIEKLGYPVFVCDAKTIAQVIEDVKKVALLLGMDREGKALSETMERGVEDIVNAISALSQKERPKVFHLIWHDPLWTAGKDTFIHEFIALAGGENVVSDLTGYVTLDLEELLRRDPDIITVVSTHGGENLPYNFVLSDERLKSLKALQHGRVFAVDGDMVSRPGPRVVDALKTFAQIIHPEVFGPYRPEH